jgi:hypothetical protein
MAGNSSTIIIDTLIRPTLVQYKVPELLGEWVEGYK